MRAAVSHATVRAIVQCVHELVTLRVFISHAVVRAGGWRDGAPDGPEFLTRVDDTAWERVYEPHSIIQHTQTSGHDRRIIVGVRYPSYPNALRKLG